MSAFPPPSWTHLNQDQPLYPEIGWNYYTALSNQTINPSAAYVQKWDSTIVAADCGQYLANNASTGVITFLEDGYYSISAQLQLQPASSSNVLDTLARIVYSSPSIPASPLYLSNQSVKAINAVSGQFDTQYVQATLPASGYFKSGESITIVITNNDSTGGHTVTSFSAGAALWITKLS